MNVIGIETSCDDTGIAIYDSKQGLLAQAIYTQTALHAQFGGVVPELASRDHVRKTIPLLRQVMATADLSPSKIDGIAYTAGPGLMGALLVGATIGRSLAWAWNIPAIGVHHLEGHLLAVMLETQHPSFPFLALLISGGHTLLIHAEKMGIYHILGETLDDAVGEAFDKTAKLLGLGYPGGAALAKLAQQGNPGRFDLPRPMTQQSGLDFSFSGLKTAVLQHWQQSDQSDQTRADLAYDFQTAVVETLLIKCQRALDLTGLTRLVVAGGVGANQHLRVSLQTMMQTRNGQVFYPRPEFCTDNGAMIAYTGCQRLLASETASLAIEVQPRWSLEDLRA